MTPPDDMEEGVGDEHDDKNERNYDKKEAKCRDVTSPDDMYGGVGDEKDNTNEIIDDEKETKCPDVTHKIKSHSLLVIN